MPWHRKLWADLMLRAVGFLLLCGAIWIMRDLFGAGPRTAMPLDYVLAAVGFAGVSAGSALTWLGHHLFDQVEVAPRWAIWRSETLGR